MVDINASIAALLTLAVSLSAAAELDSSATDAVTPFFAVLCDTKWTTNQPEYERCPGVLIHQRFVLTAATCNEPEAGYVYVNAFSNHSSPVGGSHRERIAIEAFLPSPRFDPSWPLANNLALVQLARASSFDPIQMTTSPLAEQDADLKVIGWFSTSSTALLEIPVQKTSTAKCHESFPAAQDTLVCASPLQKLQDREGFPLVVSSSANDSQPFLVGVLGASYSHSSTRGFVDLASHLGWIQATISTSHQ